MMNVLICQGFIRINHIKALRFTNICEKNTRLFSNGVEIHRIERILANRGAGSRKEVAIMLKQGRIKVKGKVVKSTSERFPSSIDILVDEKPIEEVPFMMAYNKPIGIHSTYGDPWKRPNLNLLKERFSYFKSLHPIGRLDADSSGLLLFGKDGSITQHLLNPRKKIEREYDLLALGKVNHDLLKETLAKGVNTSEGVFPGKLSFSKSFSAEKDLAYFRHLVEERNTKLMKPQESKKKGPAQTTALEDETDIDSKVILAACDVSYLRVSVTEGKYRMVRRILHNAGHSVCFLRRRRYGNILIHPDDQPVALDSITTLEDLWPIPSNLREDEVRPLTSEEILWIRSLVDR